MPLVGLCQSRAVLTSICSPLYLKQMKGYTEAAPDLTSPGALSKDPTFGLHRSTESREGCLESSWQEQWALVHLRLKQSVLPGSYSTHAPAERVNSCLFAKLLPILAMGPYLQPLDPPDSHLDFLTSGDPGDWSDGDTKPWLFYKAEEVL